MRRLGGLTLLGCLAGSGASPLVEARAFAQPESPPAGRVTMAAAGSDAPLTPQGDPADATVRPVVTLAQVERSAAQVQPQVLVARSNTDVAEAEADVARSPMLPQVVGQASYTRQTGNFAPRPGSLPAGFGAGGGSVFSTSYDYWNLNLAGTQLLYDFGQTYQRFKAARLNVDVQRYGEQVARLQVLLNVRTAYFGARAQKELVSVARETLDDQNRHLTQVQGAVQVGTQPPIALAQQKAACANARVTLIQAQNNYATAKSQLNQAAGIVGGTDYDVGDEELGPLDDEDQPLDALAARALEARPEMAVFVKQRQAQQATLSSARGGYGPTLSASAGASEAGLTLSTMVPNWNAGVLLDWPIFQGGLTQAQVHQAEAGLSGIEAQKAGEVLQVRLQVDTARLAVRAAKAIIGAAEEARDSAHEQLRLAEQRFATGVGNIIELDDAQVAYTTAAAQVVQARFGLASARAQLLAALGRT